MRQSMQYRQEASANINGRDRLPTATAVKVLALIDTIAKAKGVSDSEIATEAGVARCVMHRLRNEHLLTSQSLNKFKAWAAKQTA